MNFSDAVAIVISGVLTVRMTNCMVLIAQGTDIVIDAVFVRVDSRFFSYVVLNMRFNRGLPDVI